MDKNHFHWQSDNKNSHHTNRGQDYVNHRERNIHIHLFVRKFKEMHRKTLPFTYLGELDYVSSVGDNPMNITWKLHNALPDDLYLDLVR
ncbi:ATP-dependent helicase [Brevibacillus laterosporus GI-9]|nr:ATP-dependent helicase [Brevibacillus laterosporus GI-9]